MGAQPMGTGRLEAFSDGVMAVIITIMSRVTPKIESTVRYLGIEIDDALAIEEQVDV